MAVLGVLFIVIALVLAGAGFWVASSAGAASSTVTLFNNSLTLNPLTMMAMGAVAVLLLLLGLWLMTSAGRRRYRNHRERRDLEKSQKQQERELADTRAKLASREDVSERDAGAARGERVVREEREEPVRGTTTAAVDPTTTTTQQAQQSYPGDVGSSARGPREDGTYNSGNGATSGIARDDVDRSATERRGDPDIRR